MEEKRIIAVLRIIQGSNKYELQTEGAQLDFSLTIWELMEY